MRSTSFGRDRGLQARMLLTLFLLGLVYAVLIGVLIAAGTGAVTVAVIAGALFLVQFFTSDKIAPKPRVGIAQTSMPNAFAVGRSPRTATVCATTGILELLSPAELEGVLAHELTHVQKRDVLVMTIASFFASIASFIVQMGFCFGGAFGGALISALLKISGTMQQIPQQDLRAANSELAAFYIFPPKAKQTFATLFSTHPPLEARIAALQRLEAQLQGSACGLPGALRAGSRARTRLHHSPTYGPDCRASRAPAWAPDRLAVSCACRGDPRPVAGREPAR